MATRIAFRCLLFLGIAVIPAIGWAQRPSVPVRTLGVDELTPKNGKKMYGVVMKQSRDGVTMIVERKWFARTYPKRYKQHVEKEAGWLLRAREERLQRLKSWKLARIDAEELVDFIEEETARIEAESDDNDPQAFLKQPFTMVFFPADEIRDVFVQPPERRQVAGVAWKYQLERVTVRTVASLQRELYEQKLDVKNEPVNLSEQFTVAKLQTEREWNARKALFEYVLREPLDYQGSGTSLFKIDPDNPQKPEDLLKGLLGGIGGGGLGALGGLGGLGGDMGMIQELLDELNGGPRRRPAVKTEWWKSIASSAEADGFRGFRVTRIIPSNTSNVKVETIFLAMITPGKWEKVATFSATENRDRQSTDDMARLKADPQIEAIFNALNGLGLGGNQNLLDTALKQGAATEKAMEKCNQKFFRFIDEYTESTERPPLF